MIDLLAMLGKMGMPAGFDISSVLGGSAPTGQTPAPGGQALPQLSMDGQQGGGIPQAQAPQAAPDPRRQVDMSQLLQAIGNRPKLGV